MTASPVDASYTVPVTTDRRGAATVVQIPFSINNPINKNLFIHLLFYSGKSTGPLFHPGYTLVTKASNNRFKSVTRPTKQLHSPSKKATFAAD